MEEIVFETAGRQGLAPPVIPWVVIVFGVAMHGF